MKNEEDIEPGADENFLGEMETEEIFLKECQTLDVAQDEWHL